MTNSDEKSNLEIHGDKITAGDIQDSAVAIGQGARATIKQYTEIIIKADNFEDQPPALGESPYKGLAYFTEADKDIYFGREKFSGHLVSRLQKTRFLALVGASGSGKSSLLRAGIIPRLRSHNWLIHVINPGPYPLIALADSLTRDELDPASTDNIAKSLNSSPETLAKVGRKLASRQNASRLLLAVDQFEELFTLCKDAGRQQAFVDNLVHAAYLQGATTVLISMRADFYDRVSQFAALTDLVSQQQEYIRSMDQEDLVRVIAEPARLGGWQFVNGLVEQMIEDVGREPGRLPLLSHALLETWERRRGVVMTLGGYRDAGSVEGAIAQTAEETLNKLTAQNPAFENVTREIFLTLTELGEGSEDTRRVARRAELAVGLDEADLDIVLEELVAARLITIDKDDAEVAHEALIRRWPTLKEWLDENRERLRLERQLQRDAQLWEELGRSDDLLYRGTRLAQAAALLNGEKNNLAPLSNQFLASSREFDERKYREREAQRQRELEQAQAREKAEIEARKAAEDKTLIEEEARKRAEADAVNLRRRAIYLLGALVFAAIFAVVAFFYFQEANRNADEARNSAQEAEANLARATEALIAEETAQAEAQLNLDQALKKEAEALAESTRAVAAEQTAEAERVEALRQGERALAQSLLANSRALSASNASSKELALVRLLAVEGQRLNGRIGTALEQTAGASLLYHLAYDRHIPYQAVQILQDPITPVRVTAWDNAGKRLASAEDDGTVIIWETETWQPLVQLKDHSAAVWDIAWHDDDSLMASASSDGSVIIWDTEAWRPQTILSDHPSRVTSVAWSKEGDRLASGMAGGTIFIWDTETWQRSGDINAHEKTVRSLAWSSDDSMLASGANDDKVIVWDSENWDILETLPDHGWQVTTVAWNSDDSRLASASHDNRVIIWDTESWEAETILTEHNGWVNSVAWDDENGRLATAALDDKVIVWDTDSWQPLATLTGHFDDINSVAWNKDGSRLASAAEDNRIIIWDTKSWGPQTTLTEHDETVRKIAWSNDGRYMASASWDNKVIIWDTDSWRPVEILRGHTDDASAIVWSHDDSKLASGSHDEKIIIWDTTDWRPLETLDRHRNSVWSLDWNEDSSRLASASTDSTIIIWDTTDWRPLEILGDHRERVTSVAWNPDGSRLASGSYDSNVIIWNTDNWQPLEILENHNRFIWDLAWNSDGSRLASSSEDATITIWDTADWQPLHKLTDHGFGVFGVSWNKDDSRLASASSDNSVIIWDTDSWRPQTTLTEHETKVRDVAWNKEGSRLASTSEDPKISIWESPDFMELQCQMAGRNMSLAEWQQFLPNSDYRCTCAEWPAGDGAPSDAAGCAES